jgi:hypothetical protein
MLNRPIVFALAAASEAIELLPRGQYVTLRLRHKTSQRFVSLVRSAFDRADVRQQTFKTSANVGIFTGIVRYMPHSHRSGSKWVSGPAPPTAGFKEKYARLFFGACRD